MQNRPWGIPKRNFCEFSMKRNCLFSFFSVIVTFLWISWSFSFSKQLTLQATRKLIQRLQIKLLEMRQCYDNYRSSSWQLFKEYLFRTFWINPRETCWRAKQKGISLIIIFLFGQNMAEGRFQHLENFQDCCFHRLVHHHQLLKYFDNS